MSLEDSLAKNSYFTAQELSELNKFIDSIEDNVKDYEALEKAVSLLLLAYNKSCRRIRSVHNDPYYENSDEVLQENIKQGFDKLMKVYDFKVKELSQKAYISALMEGDPWKFVFINKLTRVEIMPAKGVDDLIQKGWEVFLYNGLCTDWDYDMRSAYAQATHSKPCDKVLDNTWREVIRGGSGSELKALEYFFSWYNPVILEEDVLCGYETGISKGAIKNVVALFNYTRVKPILTESFREAVEQGYKKLFNNGLCIGDPEDNFYRLRDFSGLMPSDELVKASMKAYLSRSWRKRGGKSYAQALDKFLKSKKK